MVPCLYIILEDFKGLFVSKEDKEDEKNTPALMANQEK